MVDGFSSTSTFLDSQLQQQQQLHYDPLCEADNCIINPVRRYLRPRNSNDGDEMSFTHRILDPMFDGTIAMRNEVQSDLPRHWWHEKEEDNELSNPYHTHGLSSLRSPSLLPNHHSQRLQKTGTTIAGVCGNGFCVLGADTRATSSRGGGGPMLVADRRAAKLHWLSDTAVAAGAGTSADLQHLTYQAAVSLALQQRAHQDAGNASLKVYNNSKINDNAKSVSIEKSDEEKENREGNNKTSLIVSPPGFLAHRIPVHTVCRWLQNVLFRGNGQLSAYLIVGGLDAKGQARLYALHPHGSMDAALAYTALGSGSYAAMSVLESRHRSDMTIDEATQLVRDAIAAGIRNDLGSGSQIDVCVIKSATNGGIVEYQRSTLPDDPLPRLPTAGGDSDNKKKNRTMGVNGFGQAWTLQRRRVIHDPERTNQLETLVMENL